MQRVCKVCNRTYTINTMGRDVEQWLVDTCSIPCLIEWFKCLANAEATTNNKIQNAILRPFQSRLEEAIYLSLKPHVNILYEPYILKMGRTIYIPDFYFPTKDVFLEVKGGKHRITKFKKFAKHYNMYILFPEVVKGVE